MKKSSKSSYKTTIIKVTHVLINRFQLLICVGHTLSKRKQLGRCFCLSREATSYKGCVSCSNSQSVRTKTRFRFRIPPNVWHPVMPLKLSSTVKRLWSAREKVEILCWENITMFIRKKSWPDHHLFLSVFFFLQNVSSCAFICKKMWWMYTSWGQSQWSVRI